VKIVRALPNKNIFFIPDRNLARFVAEQVPEKNIIANEGCCPIHAKISARELLVEKEAHPAAKVLTHPECEPEILELSDFIGSTAEIIDYAKSNGDGEYIICTEDGVEAKLALDTPGSKFYFPKTRPVCVDMKLNTLKKLLHALESEEDEVKVSDEVREGALLPLDRMLEIAK